MCDRKALRNGDNYRLNVILNLDVAESPMTNDKDVEHEREPRFDDGELRVEDLESGC
jgi:hypothetical protein